MKIFTLTRTVKYEGSALLGSFASVAECLGHLNGDDGYLMDGWDADEGSLLANLDDWDISKVANCTAGYEIEGPSDVTFTIYEITLGA